jgi:hypothetical protein
LIQALPITSADPYGSASFYKQEHLMSQPWQHGAEAPNVQQWAVGEPPAPAPKRAQPRWLIPACLAVAVLAAGLIGFILGRGSAGPSSSEVATSAQAEAAPPRLEQAFTACRGRDGNDTMQLEDDGSTIVIDTRSEYGSRVGMDCVLTELDLPASIDAEMGRTTALMGVQEADHNGIEYSWSYHPDNGVNMVITDTDAESGE